MDEALRERVGAALGRIPSGVFVCACRRGEQVLPFVASWVQQAAMDPPCVSVAVQEGRRALALLQAPDAAFTLSVLPSGANDLMRPFFGDPGPDPFGGLAVARNAQGGTYLEAAVAWLECCVLGSAPAGDHRIVIGEVVDGELLAGDREPWLHLRKSGFQY